MQLRYIPMVLADEYKHIAYSSVRVLAVHGFNNHSADNYLQFHTKFPGALTAGDVPAIKSMWFPTGAATVYGRETFGESGLYLPELLAAVSSAEVDYQAVTNTGLDITLQVETDSYMDTGFTIGGDLTTGVNSRQLWTIANGPKRLLRLDIANGSGAVSYPFIQATNSIITAIGVSTTKFIPKVADGVTRSYFFGDAGGQVINYTTSAIQQGCYIGLATSIDDDVITEDTSASVAIRAVYV